MHSCGYIEPFIDDLIESGVDVLNPVQPESMDAAEIMKKYGDRIKTHQNFNPSLDEILVDFLWYF